MIIYFLYESNPKTGALTITAQTNPFQIKREGKFSYSEMAVVSSNKRAEEILEDLEKRLIEQTGEKPSIKGLGMILGKQSFPSKIGYLTRETWAGLRQEGESPKEREEVGKANSTRHKKAYQAYSKLIAELQ